MTFDPSRSLGPFLPINQTFSTDDDQFLIQITNRDRDIARYINIREIAIFDQTEVPTGQQWYNPSNVQIKRNGYRKVFVFGAISAGASATISTAITGITQITHMWGQAISASDSRPIPYASVTSAASQVELTINPTFTTITVLNGSSAPAIVSGTVVLEYLKN